MKLEIYLGLYFSLLLFAYVVFRYIVRRDYNNRGQLGSIAATLQFCVFVGYFSFAYLFNPPIWIWFCKLADSATQIYQLIGYGLIFIGFTFTFGTMAWFGIGKAFGVIVAGITIRGPYQFSRNPQILGGYLLVIGTALLWPSFYAVGWILLYRLITHWMVITEEEHLSHFFSKDYQNYCSEVPRYLRIPSNKKDASGF